jgi:ABC-2 type transport system ATP-binding protein
MVSETIPLTPFVAPAQPAIQLRRLHRFFGRTKAVNDVSFEVEAGQVFGFIGPNGAGKTTSMRILATLELPTYGDALVEGLSCINDPDVVRKRMGFMPDGFGTYANMNCVEYVDFFARAYGLVGKERQRAVHRTLSFTGLDKIAGKSIRGLSKGMRQRLSLGRALVHDPRILILDEPANGLDPRARIELRSLIRRLAADGKAILVSSHILTELAEMCDRVAIIERGELLAVGSVDEIQRGSQNSLVVTIESMNMADPIVEFLKQHDHISDIKLSWSFVECCLAGEACDQAALLQQLVAAGFPIKSFSAKQRSLEDVFMQITTGAVQ